MKYDLNLKDIDVLMASFWNPSNTEKDTSCRHVLKMTPNYQGLTIVPISEVWWYEKVAAWFGLGPISLKNIFSLISDNEEVVRQAIQDNEKSRQFFQNIAIKSIKYNENRLCLGRIKSTELIKFCIDHLTDKKDENNSLQIETDLDKRSSSASSLTSKKEAAQIFIECGKGYEQLAQNKGNQKEKYRLLKSAWYSYYRAATCYKNLQNDEDYIKVLKIEADAGSPIAMEELGQYFLRGNGITKPNLTAENAKESLRWYRQSIQRYVELENVIKPYHLDLSFFGSRSSPFPILEILATEANLPNEQRADDFTALINYYEKTNLAHAIKLTIKAVDKCLSEGFRDKLEDLIQAFNKTNPSAKELEDVATSLLSVQNLTKSRADLAGQYLLQAIEKYSSSIDKVRCYRLMAEKLKDVDAMCSLGDSYLQGQPSNIKEALDWYYQALEAVDGDAFVTILDRIRASIGQADFFGKELEEIGLYFIGLNNTKFSDLGKHYLMQAIEKYHLDDDKVRCYELIIDKLNDADAMYNLGDFYFINNRLCKGLEWYCKALEKKHEGAVNKIKELLSSQSLQSDEFDWSAWNLGMKANLFEMFASHYSTNKPEIASQFYERAAQFYRMNKDESNAKRCFIKIVE